MPGHKKSNSRWEAAHSKTGDRELCIWHTNAEGETSQYAALHTKSSYFRLIWGPDSGWGTSIVTMPIFWAEGKLHQGTRIRVRCHDEGDNLVLVCRGTSLTLTSEVTITLSPPQPDSITAHVCATTTGELTLDAKPREAFKPVFLSSMYNNADSWDSQSAYADGVPFSFPQHGWIILPDRYPPARDFGLIGGTSRWKRDAPTIDIHLDQPLSLCGWLHADNNPNDDNIGLWAASDEVLRSWSYTITASRAADAQNSG